MADIDPRLLQELADAIKDLSKMDLFPRSPEDRSIEAMAKTLDDIKKGQSAETKKVVEAYNKAMKDVGIDKEIRSLKDVLEAGDQVKALKAMTRQIGIMQKTQYESKEMADVALQDLERQAHSAGTTLEEMGIVIKRFPTHGNKFSLVVKDATKVTDALTERFQRQEKALIRATDATNRFSETAGNTRKILNMFGGAVKTIGKDLLRLGEQEQRYAQQTATADAGWIEGITSMGIAQIDYMKVLKATRAESLAMAASGRDFKTSLVDVQQSLTGLTRDTTEAAIVSQKFHKNMARIGVTQSGLGDAMMQQTKIYEENYRALGYTAEEFANLSNELINEQGMRSTLLTLQEKDRKAYVLGIQRRMAEYQTMGYTIERAKELQKTFQALNKMGPKERMKQAAKQRAMLSAMGMGAEGAELFNLQVRYRTMSPEDKLKAEKRMTQIQSKAAGQFGNMSGAGATIGQSFVMQQLAATTGFDQVVDTFEVESGKGLKIQQDQLKYTNEISKDMKLLLKAQSYYAGAANSAVGSLGTNLISAVGGMVGGSIMGKMVASRAAGAMTKGMFKTGGMKPGGAISGPGAKNLGKIGAKAGVGSLLKKIPGLGVAAGLGYGASRLMEGDTLGALGEVGSGLVSLLPGVGTAASLGIDAWLAKRDLDKAMGGAETPEAMTIADDKPEYDPQQTLMELNATMKGLREYLETQGVAMSDQNRTLDKTATAINDAIRVDSVPGGRPMP